MGYWAYANDSTRTVTIHNGECRQCNHGLGPQWRGDIKNGRWLGPHATYARAVNVVMATISYGRLDCQRCIEGS